jgi:hypothetical protein
MIGEHRHIRVTKNAVATVGMDCSPKTLKLLKKMANLVEKKMNNISSKMESRKILPLNKRLKDGEYTKGFDSGDNFKDLHDLTKNYHLALNAAENELFQNGMGCNSDKILPKDKRLPFDNGNDYVGVSKFVFFHFKKTIKLYHKALERAEYTITNHEMGKTTKSNHGKK